MGEPRFTVSFGADDLADLAFEANSAVLDHIQSRADKRPPGRSVPAVVAFQDAESKARGGAPGSLKVDGLWGNSSKAAAAFYMSVPVADTAPTAFRGSSTWSPPPPVAASVPVAAPAPAPVPTSVILVKADPPALPIIAPVAIPAPRVLDQLAPRTAPVVSRPIIIATAPIAPTSQRSPGVMERQQALAALATYAAFQDPAVNWGTRDNPNENLRTWQRYMGGVAADGIMGPYTRERVRALGAGIIPPRPTATSSYAAPPTRPAPVSLPSPAPAAPTYTAPVPAGDRLTVQRAKPVMVDTYVKATPEPPPRGAVYMTPEGTPAVVGMREIAQESSNPGIPPVGVQTSAAAAGPSSKDNGWWLMLAALIAATNN